MSKSMSPTNRPAEAATGALGVVAGAICVLLGVTDPDKVGAVVVLLGFVPYAVTWIVTLLRSR